MPRANIYIRNEDWEKWKEIPDKSRWVAAALRGTDLPKFVKADEERKEIEKVLEPFIQKKKEDYKFPPSAASGL